MNICFMNIEAAAANVSTRHHEEVELLAEQNIDGRNPGYSKWAEQSDADPPATKHTLPARQGAKLLTTIENGIIGLLRKPRPAYLPPAGRVKRLGIASLDATICSTAESTPQCAFFRFSQSRVQPGWWKERWGVSRRPHGLIGRHYRQPDTGSTGLRSLWGRSSARRVSQQTRREPKTRPTQEGIPPKWDVICPPTRPRTTTTAGSRPHNFSLKRNWGQKPHRRKMFELISR